MAKLVILRGASRHGEIELTGQTFRIGRSAQNEIVLDDPGKGVSRTHAEIRLEGGRYTLIDPESQNGIWVSGTRVSSVVLGPEVVASVGPFFATPHRSRRSGPAVDALALRTTPHRHSHRVGGQL